VIHKTTIYCETNAVFPETSHVNILNSNPFNKNTDTVPQDVF